MTQAPLHKRGYTLVEMMLVMLLLALLGVTILTLMQAGSTAYEKIAQNRAAEADARIALSYLDVRIRQNDQRDMVWLADNPLGEGRALVIREVFGGVEYDTWIYFADGVLYECNLLDAGDIPALERSEAIARLIDYRFDAIADNAIEQTATYAYDTASVSETRVMSNVVVLRAGGGLQ